MSVHIWERSKTLFTWQTFLFILLILVVLGTFAGTVSSVVPQLGWTYLIVFALYGLGLGWILAHYEIQGKWVAVVTLLLGILLSTIRAGNLQTSLFRFMDVGANTLWNWLLGEDLVQYDLFLEAGNRLLTQVNSLYYTLVQWVLDYLNGFPRYSFLVSKYLWGWAIWFFSVWLSWSVRRHFRPLWGFLPIGTLMGILLTYIPGKNLYLLVFTLGSGLSLLGLGFFERKKREWDHFGIPFYDRVERNVKTHILIVSLLIMILAASVPSVSIEAITEPIQEWSRERAGDWELLRALGVKYQPEEETGQIQKVAKLPRSHLIGSGSELRERVVMVVNLPQGTADSGPLPREARYWRAYAYNQYTGSGWATTPVVEKEYNPGQVMSDEEFESSSMIVQEFQLSTELVGPLYAPGLPLSVNREYTTFWRTTSQNPEQFEEDFLIYKDVFAVAVYDDYYQVESAIPMADEETLRNATGAYPGWLRDRYLDMRRPAPFHVEKYAEKLVEGEATSYDKAKKIESFLRQYEYSLDLPEPPKDRDIVDYFLFDLEKGYCDYYASAMVVMARAVGIPARLAVGYVDGLYDAEGNRYLISEADAHSWPELYFQDIGWVPFEPTAQRSVIEHDQKLLPVPPELENPPETKGPFWIITGFVLRGLAALAMIFLVVLVLWLFWFDPWWLGRKTPKGTLTAIVQRLYRWGRQLQIDLQRPATPYQFLYAIRKKLSEIRTKSNLETFISVAEDEIEWLTREYVKAYYGPDLLSKAKQGEAVQIWKALRWRLVAAIIVMQLQGAAHSIRMNVPFMKKSPVE